MFWILKFISWVTLLKLADFNVEIYEMAWQLVYSLNGFLASFFGQENGSLAWKAIFFSNQMAEQGAVFFPLLQFGVHDLYFMARVFYWETCPSFWSPLNCAITCLKQWTCGDVMDLYLEVLYHTLVCLIDNVILTNKLINLDYFLSNMLAILCTMNVFIRL